jgi:hypothetical protein
MLNLSLIPTRSSSLNHGAGITFLLARHVAKIPKYGTFHSLLPLFSYLYVPITFSHMRQEGGAPMLQKRSEVGDLA